MEVDLGVANAQGSYLEDALRVVRESAGGKFQAIARAVSVQIAVRIGDDWIEAKSPFEFVLKAVLVRVAWCNWHDGRTNDFDVFVCAKGQSCQTEANQVGSELSAVYRSSGEKVVLKQIERSIGPDRVILIVVGKRVKAILPEKIEGDRSGRQGVHLLNAAV